MQDLEVIHRQNAQASRSNIARETAAGRYVVAKYTGLHYQDYAAFDTEAERNQAATDWVNAAPTHRTALHDPVAN